MVNVNNEWHQMLNLSSAALVLDFCWERIQSQGTQIQEKVYLEGHRGRRNKLETKQGSLKFRSKEGKKNLPGGKGIGKMHVYSRERVPGQRKRWGKMQAVLKRESTNWVLQLEGFYLLSRKKEP